MMFVRLSCTCLVLIYVSIDCSPLSTNAGQDEELLKHLGLEVIRDNRILLPIEIKNGLTTIVKDFITFYPDISVVFPEECKFFLSQPKDFRSLLSMYKNGHLTLSQINLINLEAKCEADDVNDMSDLLLKVNDVWFHSDQEIEMWRNLAAGAASGNSDIGRVYLSSGLNAQDENIDFIVDVCLYTKHFEINDVNMEPKHWKKLSNKLQTTSNKTAEYMGLGYNRRENFAYVSEAVLSVESVGLWNNFADTPHHWELFFKAAGERRKAETQALKTIWIYEAYAVEFPSVEIKLKAENLGIEIKTKLFLILTGGQPNNERFLSSSEIVTDGIKKAPDCMPPLPLEIGKGASAWCHDTLIFCGGAQVRQHSTNQCWSLKSGDTAWSSTRLCVLTGCSSGHQNDMNEGRAGFSLTTINNDPGEVLAIGGIGVNGHALDSMEIYSFVTSTWTKLEMKLPNPTNGHCAVQIREKYLVIIGGGDKWDHPTAAVLGIDLSSGAISTLSDLPQALWWPACTTQNDFIYVSGGNTQPFGGTSSNVYKYSITTNLWSFLGTMATARCGHIMGTTAEKLMVVAGGYSINNGFVSSIEDSYNSGKDWTERSQGLSQPREFAGMAKVTALEFTCN